MPYYAVAKGNIPGVYLTWEECKKQVNAYKGAMYKKFESKTDAEQYVSSNALQQLKCEMPEYSPEYFIYTDGACKNNGKTDAIAGIGVFFGEGDERNVSVKLDAAIYKQTNNVAELCAILHAIKIIEADLKMNMCVCIVSDSEYAIKCATTYGKSCAESGWKTEIPNIVLVKELFSYVEKYESLIFMHIPAHTNNQDVHSIGNMNADRLANESISNNTPTNKQILMEVEMSLAEIHNKIQNLINRDSGI